MNSTNVANALLAGVTSTVSISFNNKKVRYKMEYILLSFVIVIVVLLLISFICHHYTNHRWKQKRTNILTTKRARKEFYSSKIFMLNHLKMKIKIIN